MIFQSIDGIVNSYLKSRLPLLKKLCGPRIIDILLHMPTNVLEKLYIENLGEEHIGKLVSTRIKVESVDLGQKQLRRPSIVFGRNGPHIIEIVLFNLNSGYVRSSYPIGKEVQISGKLSKNIAGNFQFINPSKSLIKPVSGIYNVYPLTTGLVQANLYSVIDNALKILKTQAIDEWLPQEILDKYQFPDFKDALGNIHHPHIYYSNAFDLKSRQRICFDEILSEQLVIRLSNQITENGHKIKNNKTLIKKFLNNLPFELTCSQIDALNEIFSDLESGKPMGRLLQGDVGSGKTVVALISALYAVESGFQVAILAPTELLARQHFKTCKKFLDTLNVSYGLLTASEKGKQKKDLLNNLANGDLQILVGTHAIITNKVVFKNLGLAVIDEQHRFGVNQRLQLINKGISPHILSMTATPIPRTIVMSIYGDIEVSNLKEKPKGRKEIINSAITMSKVEDLIVSMKRIISKGQKIYWVCPLIEESEKLKYTCVTNRFMYLQKIFGDSVQMLHGKMKSSEKEEIFQRYAKGQCSILVSTTLIEVGVDVPEATVIIIENAEKFGLAQIHQLRGRVGRNDLQSYCILLHENRLPEIARKRINVIKSSNDGFEIAEQDLILRGGGEIFGTKQSGQKSYRTFDQNDPLIQEYLVHFLNDASKLARNIVESESLDTCKKLLDIFVPNEIHDIKKSF